MFSERYMYHPAVIFSYSGHDFLDIVSSKDAPITDQEKKNQRGEASDKGFEQSRCQNQKLQTLSPFPLTLYYTVSGWMYSRHYQVF